MRRAGHLTAALALAAALAFGALSAGCTTSPQAQSSPSGSPSAQTGKDVSNMEQLQIRTIRHEIAEIGEQTGNGAYGEYTEVALESDGFDALKAAFDQRNAQAAAHTQERVSAHANDPEAEGTTEAGRMNLALGGADATVEATPFINFLNECAVTRADTKLVCLLESEGAENEGWGNKVRFASHVYDAQTGTELALDDLVADPAQLPALVDEALHAKYFEGDMFAEGEDAAAVVQAKLEAGTLAWTADYLGMKFYFDSADFKHADWYQGMCVSLPYAAHPELFADACTAVPDDFIAQLEYGVAYELPGEAQGRSVRITRTHDDDNTGLGLLGTSPDSMKKNAAWTFTVQVGTGAGDDFAPAGEASNSPWFYDMYRQDYAPCLVRAGGRYYVYGFGDRNSDDYKTAVYDLNGDAPELLKELDEGFVAQACYTKWALPCNPAAVTMADRDCLASYDRITFTRDCRIDAETGLPSPEAGEYRAYTVNEAYKMRMAVAGTALDENGAPGQAATVPEGAVCVLESGLARDHYDMRLEDGSLVRLAYDDGARRIDGHYTADIMSVVPAAAAASASIESGPRQRTVWQHGREVPLVPETGNIVGTGAIIDYGDTPWWIAEEFVGTWTMTAADRELIAEWYSDGNAPTDGKLEIREDGTFTMVFDGDTYEGTLDATRGWGVYATGAMQRIGGMYGQSVWFDYTQESEADKSWSRIEFHADGLPYPLSKEVTPFQCFLTRR